MPDPPVSSASVAPASSPIRPLAEARAPLSEAAGGSDSPRSAHQTRISVLLLSSLAATLVACDSAAVSSQPRYGYVFVTSTVFYGNQLATGKSDELCKSVAAGSILNMTPRFSSEVGNISKWVAWLSYYDSMYDQDKLGGALARLKQHLGFPIDMNIWVNWYDTTWDGSGTPIFTNFTAIPAGPSRAYGGIHFDESGRDLTDDPVPQVWTATGSDGALTDAYDSCLEVKMDQNTGTVTSTRSWASESGAGRVGLLNRWGTDWSFTNQTLPCSKQAHLYCFGLVR